LVPSAKRTKSIERFVCYKETGIVKFMQGLQRDLIIPMEP